MIKKIDNSIFISGSRSVERLESLNKEFINWCIYGWKTFLIGDADGVDLLAQKYLTEKKYHNVTIFTVNNTPRNNIGNFDVTYCKIPEWTFSKAVFGVKDEEMRKICSEWYVIWDWESKWSEVNIKDLLKKGKRVTIFIDWKNIQWPIEEPFSKRKLQEKMSIVWQTSLFE